MPKDNEVDEKVIEPVAVIYPDTGLRNDAAAMALWRNHGYDTGGEPLYSAATVAELRAEVERRKDALAAMSQFAKVAEERAEAAERRVGELERACKPIIEKSIAISKKTSSVFTSDLRRLLAALTGADPT